jgi:hypothetical protein
MAANDDVRVETFKVEPYDLYSAIQAFEDGLLDEEGVVVLFQVLVSTGLIRQLQGSYQREAQRLVDAGLVQVN